MKKKKSSKGTKRTSVSTKKTSSVNLKGKLAADGTYK
jgi:hypothetical protein